MDYENAVGRRGLLTHKVFAPPFKRRKRKKGKKPPLSQFRSWAEIVFFFFFFAIVTTWQNEAICQRKPAHIPYDIHPHHPLPSPPPVLTTYTSLDPSFFYSFFSSSSASLWLWIKKVCGAGGRIFFLHLFASQNNKEGSLHASQERKKVASLV